jgi:hypothetical protein
LTTALEVIGQVTGLSSSTMNDVLQQVQANHAKLNGCERHDFDPIEPVKPLMQRYRCMHCGGEIDHHAWYWHQLGRRP